ncbi:hypothetical protein PHA77_19105 (plasmid) [Edwardsiella tarda]|uniref:hypothetical protein n=1 Tax=Edwardsiella tarda TaxID=636 RepID=UPI002444820C|nr:hypothetical protein [Edwardsiella tarda]WGE31091.1 hypothetical protein PHA77_19105 [Edwardsiella tarda]
MFESISDPTGFGYPFEKIRHAISVRDENNLYAATVLGLDILLARYAAFADELTAVGEIGTWAFELETYDRAIHVLQDYFGDNARDLTEHDAWIYYQYLESEHERFCQIAEEIAKERRAE